MNIRLIICSVVLVALSCAVLACDDDAEPQVSVAAEPNHTPETSSLPQLPITTEPSYSPESSSPIVDTEWTPDDISELAYGFSVGDNYTGYHLPTGTTICHFEDGLTEVYGPNDKLILSVNDSDIIAPGGMKPATKSLNVPNGAAVIEISGTANITKVFSDPSVPLETTCLLTIVYFYDPEVKNAYIDGEKVIPTSCSDTSQSLLGTKTVTVGEQFDVCLEITLRLGADWSEIHAEPLLSTVSSTYTDDNPAAPGLGGKRCFVFEATNSGDTAITFTRDHGGRVLETMILFVDIQ